MKHLWTSLVAFFVSGLLVFSFSWAGGENAAAPERTTPARVDFNRDIRPLLSDNCYHCHGPDEGQRKGDFRLDVKAHVFADRGGYSAVVPRNPLESELLQRISSDVDQERMPPPGAESSLSKDEIQLIRRWIEQGAEWKPHWAFITPKRPMLPAVEQSAWPRNSIDHFVLAQLEQNGLKPSPEADRETLIRRISLDLTGLPPSLDEIDAFLKDESPNAYEKVADRLLHSPRYGERMAVPWLNAARYADTDGYQTDGPRFMWRWRDWVIDAFNRNMPYDQFTIEQIAGDMLPNATLNQKIATGFNRNHRLNAEGGLIAEEYQVEYVVDRVDTTSTVWMGLTMGCARCHDHKYDPISQQDFYQLFAFFNNIPESGKAKKFGNSPPYIKAPTPAQRKSLADLDKQISDASAKLDGLSIEIERELCKWLHSDIGIDSALSRWWPNRKLSASFELDLIENLKIETKEDPAVSEAAQSMPGVFGNAVFLDGAGFINAGNAGKFGFTDKFTLSVWVYLDQDSKGTILSRMMDIEEGQGYLLALEEGRLYVALTNRWLDDGARLKMKEKLPVGQWTHVLMSYDGSQFAKGIKVYVDGHAQQVDVLLDEINISFAVNEPLRIGGGGGPDGQFMGGVDEVRLFNTVLTPDEVGMLANAEPIPVISWLPADKRTKPQRDRIRAGFLAEAAPVGIRNDVKQLQDLLARREQLWDRVPTTMVMKEAPGLRKTHILRRGQYDLPDREVVPAYPKSIQFDNELPAQNRLDFARWVVHPNNPLTARVTVNRYWQMYFGNGPVKTVEDFGAQGEWPSHPGLLDWLARELVESGWNVKALHRLIVTSATYRQSARVTPEKLQADPENRLLSRGPRARLPAEMVRDQALSISGLLVEKVGGPSVKPYQPPGLWTELTGGGDYEHGKGDDLYRRSLYTYWKRTIPPPAMMNFDAAARESCIVRQSRTNTPLQALNLMNDVTYAEAARKLGERMIIEGGEKVTDRLTFAFRLATGRRPSVRELEILTAAFKRYLADFEKDEESARKLAQVGEAPADESLPVAERAAYATIAATIMNLDEAVTKP